MRRRSLGFLVCCFWITLVASASNRVTPEIEIQLAPEGGALTVPMRVRLMTRSTFGNFKQLDEIIIPAGEANGVFPANKSDSATRLGLVFSWLPEGLPRREMVLVSTVRRKRIDGFRLLTYRGGERSHYMLEDGEGGNCGELFQITPDKVDRWRVVFKTPQTYLPCERGGRKQIKDVFAVANRDINAGTLNYYKFDDDIRMGKQFYTQLDGTDEHPELKDPKVNAYIKALVARIGKASDLPDLDFQVTVIDADILNAFAVPGGYIWVYRGLIENTENEAELAGVIAHELAHVTSRHGTEGVSSAITKSVAALAVGEILAQETDEAWARDLIRGAVMGGTNFWIIGGNRKREAEADKLGVQYAWRAGFDPRGIATLFGRWAEQKDRKQTRLDQLFSGHPNDEVRVANVMRDVGYFLPPKDDLIVSSQEYLDIKEHLKTLPPPKKSGQVVGNALFSTYAEVNESILYEEIFGYLEGGEQEK